jgi:predicted nucleic acid-binding protein
MRYILDTDWIINLLAGRQDAKVKIEQLDPEEIGVSLVTVAEIYESAFNYSNPERTSKHFAHSSATSNFST